MVMSGREHIHRQASGVPLAIAFHQGERENELFECVLVSQPRTHSREERLVPDEVLKIHRSVEARLLAGVGHDTRGRTQLNNRYRRVMSGLVQIRSVAPSKQV